MAVPNWIAQILERLTAKRHAPFARSAGKLRLQLEMLEDRVVPATLTVGSGQTYTDIAPALLQSATDYTSSGSPDTIQILPGTYTGNYNITKPVVLQGTINATPTFSNNAYVSNPSTMSIVEPASPHSGTYNDVFRVLSSGVTIQHLFIDGLGAADDGISNLDSSGNQVAVNNISISSNYIQNAAAGIYLDDAVSGNFSPSVASFNNSIASNSFANSGTGGYGAINLYNNFFSTVQSNAISVPASSASSVGIELNTFNTSGINGSQTLAVSSNTITVGQDSAGVFINNVINSPIAINLSGNTIEAAAGVTQSTPDGTYGVSLKTIQGGATVTETSDSIGNTGGQFARGVSVWNAGTGAVTLASTTIGTTTATPAPVIGVEATDTDPSYGTATAPVAIKITGGTVTGTEYGLDLVSSTLAVTGTVTGVGINGVGTSSSTGFGINLSGSLATAVNSGATTTVTGTTAALPGTAPAGLNKTFLISGSTITVAGTTVTANAIIGTSGRFTITAPGTPAPTLTLYSSSPQLPNGVSFNPNTGAFSWPGNLSTVASYTLTFQATVGSSTVSQVVIFSVGNAPVIAPVITITGTLVSSSGSGSNVTYTVSALSTASGYFYVSASGTPAPTVTYVGSSPTLNGVSFNPNTGKFAWPANLPLGSYTLTFQAANGVTTTQPVTFNVSSTTGTAPTLTGPSSNINSPVLADVGTSGNFYVVGNGNPSPTLTLSSSPSLPMGLSFNPNTGKFSWPANLSPSLAGTTYTLTFTASNGVQPNATFVVYWEIVNPQILVGPRNTNLKSKPLTQAQLTPVVNAAIAIWQKAGISAIQTALLRSTQVSIAKLGSDLLANTGNGKITIDATADGDGWYIGSTPTSNVGFTQVKGTKEYVAKTGPASTEVDLLTVVLHEMGHILGLNDLNPALYPDDLMSETITVGVRRLP